MTLVDNNNNIDPLCSTDAEMAFWSKRGPVGMLHNAVRFIRASPQRIEMFAATVIGGLVAEFDVVCVNAPPVKRHLFV
jgi:hypothetical protein